MLTSALAGGLTAGVAKLPGVGQHIDGVAGTIEPSRRLQPSWPARGPLSRLDCRVRLHGPSSARH
ncbi:hypothetical protein [Ottowia sp.]|uniref:hypothetical protein n=1 Tax=Ottowia sp. TaxID=1898956 RepID=UPI0039E3D334